MATVGYCKYTVYMHVFYACKLNIFTLTANSCDIYVQSVLINWLVELEIYWDWSIQTGDEFYYLFKCTDVCKSYKHVFT